MGRGRKAKDYTGQIHGCWEVIERDYFPNSNSHETFWKCKCLNCGNEASVRKTDLDKNPISCNNCKGKQLEKYPINIGDKFGLLTVIDRPRNPYSTTKCKCACGNIINVRKSHLLGLNRHSKTISCGCATKTAGEIKIEQILKTAGIQYQSQYRIREFNISAPFDYAIFNQETLLCLIEYDGEQHFKPIEFFGGEEAFQKQQERDQKKDEWCKENNIPLLRIPYTDYEQLDAEYLFSKIPKIGGESNFAFSI